MEIFSAIKIEIFRLKNFDIFNIMAQNIDCGYTLAPSWRGGSNEYPQSMFWIKDKKNKHTPVLLYKSGMLGSRNNTDLSSSCLILTMHKHFHVRVISTLLKKIIKRNRLQI